MRVGERARPLRRASGATRDGRVDYLIWAIEPSGAMWVERQSTPTSTAVWYGPFDPESFGQKPRLR